MYLYSRRGRIYDLNKAAEVFVGRAGNTVSLGLSDGRTFVLEEYQTGEHAKEAIAMIAEALATGKTLVFTMPEEQELQLRLKNKYPDTERYSKTGKKTKGHGGS